MREREKRERERGQSYITNLSLSLSLSLIDSVSVSLSLSVSVTHTHTHTFKYAGFSESPHLQKEMAEAIRPESLFPDDPQYENNNRLIILEKDARLAVLRGVSFWISS